MLTVLEFLNQLDKDTELALLDAIEIAFNAMCKIADCTGWTAGETTDIAHFRTYLRQAIAHLQTAEALVQPTAAEEP